MIPVRFDKKSTICFYLYMSEVAGLGKEYQPLPQYPTIHISEWENRPKEWLIKKQDSQGQIKTLSPVVIRDTVDEFFSVTLANNPYDYPEHPIRESQPGASFVRAKFINEGDFNVIALFRALDDETDTIPPASDLDHSDAVILVLSKDLESGNTQTASDHTNLPFLKASLPKDFPLRVPTIYNGLFEMAVDQGMIKPWQPKDVPLNAFFAEFLDGYAELSCAQENGQPVFRQNRADSGITTDLLKRDLLVASLDPSTVTQGLARNQAGILFATGMMQGNFRINAGDYMIMPNQDGTYSYGLITLRGGMETVTPAEGIARLFLHSEEGFLPSTGTQPGEMVTPFADSPEATIRGVMESYQLCQDRAPLPPLGEILAEAQTIIEASQTLDETKRAAVTMAIEKARGELGIS